MNDTTLTFITTAAENPDGDDVENACVDGACALPAQPQDVGAPTAAEPIKSTETERTP